MRLSDQDGIDEATRKKILSYCSLAMKAGKLVSGEFATEKAIKEGKAVIVIVSEEASENTKKHFVDSATFYAKPVYFFGEKEELGGAIGKEFRASLAILDKGLAEAIKKQMDVLGHADQRRR